MQQKSHPKTDLTPEIYWGYWGGGKDERRGGTEGERERKGGEGGGERVAVMAGSF